MKKSTISKVAATTLVAAMAAGMLAGCGSSTTSTTTTTTTTADETGSDDAAEATTDDGSVDTSEMTAKAEEMGAQYEGEDVSLTFWYLSTRSNSQAICDVWNAANPNMQVTLSTFDTDGIKDNCKTATQSGSMPSMWFNWGGALGQYYVDEGVTYDITDYLDEHGLTETINSGALSLCQLSGTTAGYPTSYNVLGMFYRTDIFEQYGIEVPTTMDEFTAACATLKENGITPLTTAGLNGWHVMRLIEQFIEYEAGAELHDELQALTASWDCDAVVNALTTYQEYCQAGYFPDGFVTASPDDVYIAFAQGICAMDIQGQWYDGTLRGNEISLDNVGWFPFPNGTGRMSAFAEMTQFNANLTDDELDAAMLFTQYWFSNEVARVYSADFNLPLPYTYADPVNEDDNPHVQEMLDYSSENGTFTITDQAFPTQVADVLFSYQDAIANGEATPEEAAPAIQAAIDEYLAQ